METSAASASNRKRRDLTTGSIVKNLSWFILPILIGNIFTQFYNVVDSAVVGQFVGSGALAAVGSCFTIQMIVNSVFAGLGYGSMTVSAHYYGAKQQENMAKAVVTAFFVALFIGLIMTGIGLLAANPVLRLVNTPDTIIADATLYLRIVFVGCLGHLIYNMGNALLRGIGDSVFPLILLICCSVLNLGLDFLFVIRFGMGVAGVAWATVIAQSLSGVALILRVKFGPYGIKLTRDTFRPSGSIAKSIARIGFPSAIQGITTSSGMLIIQSFVNRFGEDVVATNTVIQKLDGFVLLPIMAIGMGVTAFVGQNLGAKRQDRVNKVIPIFGSFAFGYGLLIAGLLWLFGKYVIMIFTTNAAVIELGVNAIRIVAFSYWATGVYNLLISIIRGAGATTITMMIAILSSAIQVPLCYLFAVVRNDYQGVYMTTCIIAAINLTLSALFYRFGGWRKTRVIGEEDEGGQTPGESGEMLQRQNA